MTTNTFTNVFKCLMFAAIAFFFTIGGYAIYVGINAAKVTQTKINTALDSVNVAVVELNKSKTGVIAQLYGTIHDARLTLDNTNKAAIDERLFLEKQQPLEMEKLNAILDQTNSVLTTANSSINLLSINSNAVLHSVDKDIATANGTLAEATVTIHSANALVSDQNIPKTLDNIQQTTASTAAMVKDTQTAWHKFLHPSWMQKLYSGVTGAGVSIAKFFW